jgi:hypothetical protein
MALQPGEKYLTLDMSKLKFFRNKNKKSNKDPDYYARVPLWVNEKRVTADVKEESVI